MSTLQEIQTAVSELPPEELSAFRAWFAEFDARVWDQEFEQDVAAGRQLRVATAPAHLPPVRLLIF